MTESIAAERDQMASVNRVPVALKVDANNPRVKISQMKYTYFGLNVIARSYPYCIHAYVTITGNLSFLLLLARSPV